MKRATMRTKVLLFVAAMLAASLGAVGAHAQAAYADSGHAARFTLPYEVHWGKAVLPAGEYSISVRSTGLPALVRSRDGKNLIFTPAPVVADKNEGGPASALLIAVLGNQREVLSLSLPHLGNCLVFRRLSQAEREMITRIDSLPATPVTAASR